MDYIQEQIDNSSGAQLEKIIFLCKSFIATCRDNNEFNEAEPLLNTLVTLRDAAIAECIRRDINFTV